MNKKYLLIILGIFGVIYLGGCQKAPIEGNLPEPNEVIEEQVVEVDEGADNNPQALVIDEAYLESIPVWKLPKIEGYARSTPKISEENENDSIIRYSGLDNDAYLKYKEALSNDGFTEWTTLSDRDGVITEESISGERKVSLSFDYGLHSVSRTRLLITLTILK